MKYWVIHKDKGRTVAIGPKSYPYLARKVMDKIKTGEVILFRSQYEDSAKVLEEFEEEEVA